MTHDKVCQICGKEFIGGATALYCPECRDDKKKQHNKNGIKYGKMPNSLCAKYKVLYEIWELSKGTGVLSLGDWTYKDKDGKVCYYKNIAKLRTIPPVLKLYRRGDYNLPEDVIYFLDNNPSISNVLRYEGSQEEMRAAIKYIEDMHKSVDYFFDK